MKWHTLWRHLCNSWGSHKKSIGKCPHESQGKLATSLSHRDCRFDPHEVLEKFHSVILLAFSHLQPWVYFFLQEASGEFYHSRWQILFFSYQTSWDERRKDRADVIKTLCWRRMFQNLFWILQQPSRWREWWSFYVDDGLCRKVCEGFLSNFLNFRNEKLEPPRQSWE